MVFCIKKLITSKEQIYAIKETTGFPATANMLKKFEKFIKQNKINNVYRVVCFSKKMQA